MTGNQLLEILQGMNEEQRSRPVYLMVVDEGITCAEKVVNCFAAQPYDGELIWIVTE